MKELIPFLSLLAQVFIGVSILISGRSIARAQYSKSIQDAWNDYNKVVLSSEENLKTTAEMNHSVEPLTLEQSRKTFLTIMLLNIHESEFLGKKHNLLSNDFNDNAISDLLIPLLSEPQAYGISQNRGFSPEFKAYCKQLHESKNV